jgi:hypothetical protein
MAVQIACRVSEVPSYEKREVRILSNPSQVMNALFISYTFISTVARDELTMDIELGNAICFKPVTTNPKGGPRSYGGPVVPNITLNEVAEREILVTLLSLLEAATKRKNLLLHALEDFHTGMVQNLPFGGQQQEATVPKDQQHHYGWIRANLDQTNQTLREALSKMRLLYGKAYLPAME